MTETKANHTESRGPETDLLAHPYRRYLLYTLYLYTSPIQLADVAHQITVWETGDPASQHLDRRLEIYMDLYHDHLPVLTDAAIVEYDQQEDAVDLGPRGEHLKPVVRREFGDEVKALLEAEAGTFDVTE